MQANVLVIKVLWHRQSKSGAQLAMPRQMLLHIEESSINSHVIGKSLVPKVLGKVSRE